jgi:hypothetical protein
MEGGVALFLLFILVVVAAIAGIALYLTGGALIAKRDHGKDGAEGRPQAPERPTTPTQEKVTFAGSEQDPRHRDDPA